MRLPCLLPLCALLAAWDAGVLWLAQISGYPLWPLAGSAEFLRYYAVWARASFWLISLPLFLTLAASVAALVLHPGGIPGWQLWGWFLLEAAVVALTVALRTPSAAHLPSTTGALTGFVRWHWIRVALATVAAVWIWQTLGRVWLPAASGSTAFRWWLLLITTAFGCVSVAQVWMVQTLCYRLWPVVGKQEFYGYHMAWWHSIWTSIFVPAGLTLLGAIALLRWRPPGSSGGLIGAAFALQMLLGLLTAVWWGPLMGRLATQSEGLLPERYRLLMSTHWLRVAIVTAYGVVTVWALAQTAARAAQAFAGKG